MRSARLKASFSSNADWVVHPDVRLNVVAPDKRLAAYVERCASRPAFKRALDAHLQDFQSPI